jgi:hypothetical protein
LHDLEERFVQKKFGKKLKIKNWNFTDFFSKGREFNIPWKKKTFFAKWRKLD